MIDRRTFTAAAGAWLLLAGLGARPALAQTRPFLFTVAPEAATPGQSWTVSYDVGYADQTAEPFGYDGAEQRIGVRGALGNGFTVLGRFGLGLRDGSDTRITQTSQQVELLKDLRSGSGGLRLAVGAGMRREWDGTSVALARLSAGSTFERSTLFSNLRFEKAFASGRDGLDVVANAGWLHRAGPALQLGVEAVGEDIEGLWEADEAEGGAKLFLGPSIHVAPEARPWSASLCGGPVVYLTNSGRTSSAARPLGATGNGFTVRLSVAYSF